MCTGQKAVIQDCSSQPLLALGPLRNTLVIIHTGRRAVYSVQDVVFVHTCKVLGL